MAAPPPPEPRRPAAPDKEVAQQFVRGYMATIFWHPVRMRDEDQLFLSPAAPPRSDRTRDDLYGIADDLEFIKVQLARIALRDRPPGRFGKILLIVCAVLHGVLGALVVGLVGWPAFAFSYMFVLAWVMAFVARSIAMGLSA